MHLSKKTAKITILAILLMVFAALNQYTMKVSVDLKGKNFLHQAIVTYGVALILVLGGVFAQKFMTQNPKKAPEIETWSGQGNKISLALILNKEMGRDHRFLIWSTAIGTLLVAFSYYLQGYLTPGLGSYISAIPWGVPFAMLMNKEKCKKAEVFLILLGFLAVIVTGQFKAGDSSRSTLLNTIGLLSAMGIYFAYQDTKIKTFTMTQGPLNIELVRKTVSMITLVIVFAASLCFSSDQFEFSAKEYLALILRGLIGTFLSFLILLANAMEGQIYSDLIRRFGQMIGLIALIALTNGHNLLVLVLIAVVYLYILLGVMKEHTLQTGS